MAQSYRRTGGDSRVDQDSRASLDRIAADWDDALRLLGRILIGGIFVQSGFDKLLDLDGFATMLGTHALPLAPVIAPLGLATRYAAVLMIAFVITATAISHRFWALPPDEQPIQMVQFAKNMAIIGGFLFVLAAGGGELSLDRWRRRRV